MNAEKTVSDLLEVLLDNEADHKIDGVYFCYILQVIQKKLKASNEKETVIGLIQGIKKLNQEKKEEGSSDRALLYLEEGGDNAFAIAYFQESSDGYFIRREGKQVIRCKPQILEEVQAALS